MSFHEVNGHWCEKPLSAVATIERKAVAPNRISPDARFVGLEHIDSDGRAVESVSAGDAQLASTKFCFHSEHILYGKLRPYLRKIARPSFSGVCSTDILPISVNPKLIDRDYLYHYLRQECLVRLATARAIGANLPRLSPRTLEEFPISYPRELAEQRRIAAILDKADHIRCRWEQALALTGDFLRSAYAHLVGFKNQHHADWTPYLIEQLAAPHKGAMRTGPFGSNLRHSEFVDDGIAVLGIDNAVTNRFCWGDRRFITEEKYKTLRRYQVFGGDVIITIMGTTGRSAVVPENIPPAITTKHLAAITVDRSIVLPEFLSFAIHSDPLLIGQIQRANKGAIMSGLNLGIIKSLKIRVPPLQDQRKFASLLRKTQAMNELVSSPVVSGENLFNSLSQRAFRGEL